MKDKGVSTSVAVTASVLVTAIIVGSAVYFMTPKGQEKPPGDNQQITQGDVETFLEGADEATLEQLTGEYVPQSVLSKVSTAPRNVTFGWITPSVIEGSTWNTSMKTSLDWLAETYPNVNYIKNTKVGPEDTPSVAKGMINEKGADILIGNFEYTGLKFMSEGVYQDFPDKYFCINIAGSVERERNAIRYFGKQYQVFYLCGMLAGALTETNNIGCPIGKAVPQVSRHLNAFILGAKRVNPEAKLYIKNVNAWYDPPTTSEMTKILIEDFSCDVMWQHTDSSAAVDVATQKDVWFIGKDIDFVDQGWATGETVATSYTWHWEAILDRVLKDYLAGDRNPQNLYFLGMDSPIMTEKGLVPVSDMEYKDKLGADAISPAAKEEISQDIIDEIRAVRERMVQGTWDPFMQELVASGQTGNYEPGEVISPEGELPSKESLLTDYYLVEGILSK